MKAVGRSRNSHSGFTLVEVMVSVFVLAIGLLGVTALQLQSKHAGLGAVHRTTATLLAHEISEKMRNNPSRLGDYINSSLGGGSITSEPTPKCDGSGSCTPAQLASHDLWEWEQALDGYGALSGGDPVGGLAFPTGCINGPAGGGEGIYNIAIAWRGQTSISDQNANNCGTGSGKYDGEPGDEAHRNVLEIQVYFSDD